MANIFLASSWRNDAQPAVLKALLDAGHEVYDFRNPPGGPDFTTKRPAYDSDILASRDPKLTALLTYRKRLGLPAAIDGFASDLVALQAADTVVLLLPCGRMAQLEADYAAGAGKRVLILQGAKAAEDALKTRLGAIAYASVDEVLAAIKGAGK